jgi:hypothetical protein
MMSPQFKQHGRMHLASFKQMPLENILNGGIITGLTI